MHYVPGTPWFGTIGAELELEVAAGHVRPAVVAEANDPGSPLRFIAWVLGLEAVLVSLILWFA